MAEQKLAGGDQLSAERQLWGLVDAGLIEIAELRDRRGDWQTSRRRLTAETFAAMRGVALPSKPLLTIENLTAFEEAERAGDTDGHLALYTGGFITALDREFLALLVDAGLEEVWHWGDIDPGGLAILRHLQSCLPVPVRLWRMEPALLETLPSLPLSEEDRKRLHAWQADPQAPLQELAAAMLQAGRKVEQEGWFLGG